MPARHRWTGTRPGRDNRVTPEVLKQMVDLLPTIGSLRDLCAITGLRLDAVRRETAPFRAIMKLQGTHPKCGCGRDRFHPYGCADSFAKGRPQDCLPGHTREQTPGLLQRRKLAVEMLIGGCRLVEIERALGIGKGGAKSYRRFLTENQAVERERNMVARQAATTQLNAVHEAQDEAGRVAALETVQ